MTTAIRALRGGCTPFSRHLRLATSRARELLVGGSILPVWRDGCNRWTDRPGV
jgi:hypothetical protein